MMSIRIYINSADVILSAYDNRIIIEICFDIDCDNRVEIEIELPRERLEYLFNELKEILEKKG